MANRIIDLNNTSSFTDNQNLGAIIKTLPIREGLFVSVTEKGIVRVQSKTADIFVFCPHREFP